VLGWSIGNVPNVRLLSLAPAAHLALWLISAPFGGKLGNVHGPAWSPNGDAFRRRLTKAHVGSSSSLTLAPGTTTAGPLILNEPPIFHAFRRSCAKCTHHAFFQTPREPAHIAMRGPGVLCGPAERTKKVQIGKLEVILSVAWRRLIVLMTLSPLTRAPSVQLLW
jgi:hypothetical protein